MRVREGGSGDNLERRQLNGTNDEEEGKLKSKTGIGASLTPDCR